MKNNSFKGIPEDDRIRLTDGVQRPDNVKVRVIVRDASNHQSVHVSSPRLVRPEQSIDFKKEVLKKMSDVDL